MIRHTPVRLVGGRLRDLIPIRRHDHHVVKYSVGVTPVGEPTDQFFALYPPPCPPDPAPCTLHLCSVTRTPHPACCTLMGGYLMISNRVATSSPLLFQYFAETFSPSL